MSDIIAGRTGPWDDWGQEPGGVLVIGTGLPVGTEVVRDWALDAETYAETTLPDGDLLAIALQDALDAHKGGKVGGPKLDEVALRRAQRRAMRRDTNRVLRLGGAA